MENLFPRSDRPAARKFAGGSRAVEVSSTGLSRSISNSTCVCWYYCHCGQRKGFMKADAFPSNISSLYKCEVVFFARKQLYSGSVRLLCTDCDAGQVRAMEWTWSWAK